MHLLVEMYLKLKLLIFFMKKGLVAILIIIILLFVPFVLAYGDEGDKCHSDEGCSGTLVCAKKVCSVPSTSESTSDESTSDISVSTSSVASGDDCIAHQDCPTGEACDYSIYSCDLLISLSAGACTSSSGCNEGYGCVNRYCIAEDSSSISDAGIKSDNPFLGLVDNVIDTAVSYTSNDPVVQQQIAQEGVKESQSLDQRRAQGQISETGYTNAKTQSGQKSVQ